MRGNQMVSGFHFTPLPAPVSRALPDCTHQNSSEGDGCVNLLETKEITTEKVSQAQREPCRLTSVGT